LLIVCPICESTKISKRRGKKPIYKCQKCGHAFNNPRVKTFSESSNKFIEQSDNKYIQIARDFVKVCPKCKSKNITVRRRKTPKYRCAGCHNEFDDPKAKIVYTTQKQRNDFGRQYSNPDE
jgi:ribosomal protein L37AE/L43A